RKDRTYDGVRAISSRARSVKGRRAGVGAQVAAYVTLTASSPTRSVETSRSGGGAALRLALCSDFLHRNSNFARRPMIRTLRAIASAALLTAPVALSAQ